MTTRSTPRGRAFYFGVLGKMFLRLLPCKAQLVEDHDDNLISSAQIIRRPGINDVTSRLAATGSRASTGAVATPAAEPPSRLQGQDGAFRRHNPLIYF